MCSGLLFKSLICGWVVLPNMEEAWCFNMYYEASAYVPTLGECGRRKHNGTTVPNGKDENEGE